MRRILHTLVAGATVALALAISAGAASAATTTTTSTWVNSDLFASPSVPKITCTSRMGDWCMGYAAALPTMRGWAKIHPMVGVTCITGPCIQHANAYEYSPTGWIRTSLASDSGWYWRVPMSAGWSWAYSYTGRKWYAVRDTDIRLTLQRSYVEANFTLRSCVTIDMPDGGTNRQCYYI